MKNKLISLFTTLCIIATMFGTVTVIASVAEDIPFAQCTEHQSHDEYTLLDEQYIQSIEDSSGYLNPGNYYLNNDVSTSSDISVFPGADVTICLNGHTLTMTGPDNCISTLAAECNLTIKNGSLVFQNEYQHSIIFKNGTLTIDNCDLLSNTTQSIIYGDQAAPKINIINSKIRGTEAYWAIYQADGELNISNSEICDITKTTESELYGVYLKSGLATITDLSIHNLSANGHIYGIYANNSATNIDIQSSDIYDLKTDADSTNGNPITYAVYLDSEFASIKDCSRIEHCIYNNSAHISEISNVTSSSNDISLLNGTDGIIDKIDNCSFTSNNTAIHNNGTISSISGGLFTAKSQLQTNAALLNTGPITSINNNAEFHGVNAIKNEDSGEITIDNASVIGTVFDDWTSQDKIYSYAINPSSGGTVTINNGNFGCAVHNGDDANDLKLFPDSASGITINGGNFQLEIPSGLITNGYTNTASQVEQFPYTIGEADYKIEYNLDGGTNDINNPSSYTISTGVTSFHNPTKQGYTFKGWQDSSGNPVTSIAIGTTGDIELTATWERNPVYYDVTLTDITGFTADKQPVTSVQEDNEYKVTLSPISDDYLVSQYDTYNVVYTETGTAVDGAAYEYSTADRTATITIPNVQGAVSIICKAKLCTHDYSRTIITPPTCTETGTATDECKICHKIVSPVTVDSLGHSYVYSAEGNKITEICENDCGHSAAAILSITCGTAASAADYEASVEYSENWAGAKPSVTYAKNGQQVSIPEGAGAYKASITIEKSTASIEYCTVSFYDETNLLEVQIVSKNDKASIPANPTKPNYTFDTWLATAGETAAFDFNTAITAETAVYAAWTATTYNVVLDTDEGTINKGDITNYTYGTGAILPTEVTKSGYTFSGWYDNKDLTGNAVTAITSTDSGDKTYYAKWTKNPPSEYTITFVNFDGTILQSENVPVNTMPKYSGTEPTKPQDDKYTYAFSGWDPNLSAVIGIETYTAQFTAAARVYNVILNTNEGTINSGNITSYTYGTGSALPTDLQRDGYTFNGWFDNEDCTGNAITEISSTDTGDKTYYAKWTVDLPKEYLITFVNDDNSELQSVMVKAGETPVYTGATPTKAPDDKYTYTFSGWSPEIVPVRSAATYRAVYIASDTPAAPTAAPSPTKKPSTGTGGGSKNSGLSIGATISTASPTAAATAIPNASSAPEPTAISGEWTNPFKDVSIDNWFYESVKYISQNDIMNGMSADMFEANTDITRGMFVTVLYRIECTPSADNLTIFKDVPTDAYYSNAVAWAVDNGIVTGYNETEFRPNNSISREEMSAIIYRYAVYKEKTPQGEWAIRLNYNDLADVEDYAMESLMFNTMKNILQGDQDNNFNPKATATRAEAAAVFERVIKNILNAD